MKKPLKWFVLIFLFLTNALVYGQCGSERWEVKTLSDAEAGDIKFTPIKCI